MLQVAAVFFCHLHLALLDLDAGLKVQQVCAQRLHAGAAPALVQVQQRADDK